MVPITCSYRVRCRMFSSCLTCPIVPPAYSVRRPVVSSSFRRSLFLLACLVSSCSLARPASLPASLLVGRDAWRYASALFAITAVMRMSCGCRADVVRRLAACSSVRLRPVRLSPRSLDTVGGEGSGCRLCLLLSDFYCGARFLWIASVVVAGAASPWYINVVS